MGVLVAMTIIPKIYAPEARKYVKNVENSIFLLYYIISYIKASSLLIYYAM